MAAAHYPHLLAPLDLGFTTLRNRTYFSFLRLTFRSANCFFVIIIISSTKIFNRRL